MNNIYVYAEHNHAAVGAFIGVCLIDTTLDLDRLTTLHKAYRYYKELTKAGKLIYVDHMVQIEDINEYDTHTMYSEVLDGLLLSLGITQTEGVRSKQCPYSNLFKLSIGYTLADPGLRLTQYIVRSRRIGWIKKIANPMYPHYCWLDNYGLDTYHHAKQVMLYGSDLTLHTKDFLFNLGKYWLQGLREYDLELVTGYDYLKTKKTWWHSLFKNNKFLDCLTEEELDEVSYLTGYAHAEHPDIKTYIRIKSAYI